MADETQQGGKNTNRELWREEPDEDYSSQAVLFVTEGGGIGINVSGRVFVKPIRDWWRLAFNSHDD
jgi:hypothetical protein